MNDPFRMGVRTFDRGVILDMIGDITKAAENTIMNYCQWEQGLPAGQQYLLMNFLKVPYINSAGIAILIRITRSGIKSGRFHTFVYGLNTHYQKLFRMVGLTEHMMIYPDEYAIMQRIEDVEDQTNG